MKTVIRASLVAALALAALFIGYKVAVRSPFGAGAALFLAILGLWSLFSLLSLRLYDRGRAELITNAWLALLFTAGTYLIVEVALGFYLIETPSQIPDRIVHHRPTPNRSSVATRPDFRYTRRFNNLGLRGRDVSPAKDHATYRIVMLGDSFTGGRGVTDDETFSALLERALNEDAAAGMGRRVEVVNAGVNSYSPILSLLQLGRQLPPLDPDLVVLNFDMSDLVQESLYRARATHATDGEPLGVDGSVTFEGPFTGKVRRFIRRHLYFTRLIVTRLEGPDAALEPGTLEYWISRADPALLQHTLASDTVNRTGQWDGVFDSILRIKRYCDERGSDFLLTTYPWGHQVGEDEWAQGREAFLPEEFALSDRSVERLEDFSTANGIEFLNTFPAFRAYRAEERLYYDLDMHWTVAGHRLMAGELDGRIRARFLRSGSGEGA
jgi:hypothetical protein